MFHILAHPLKQVLTPFPALEKALALLQVPVIPAIRIAIPIHGALLRDCALLPDGALLPALAHVAPGKPEPVLADAALRILNVNHHCAAFAAFTNHLLPSSPGLRCKPDIRVGRCRARTLEFAELRRLAGYIAQRRVVAADLDVRDSVHHYRDGAAFAAPWSPADHGAPLHVLRA